ncbi:hypothetical protein Mapa_010732 [Marchantia paleacea]|nr:hypothetical protein Mapa_010732 [Marchantia paleacea]
MFGFTKRAVILSCTVIRSQGFGACRCQDLFDVLKTQDSRHVVGTHIESPWQKLKSGQAIVISSLHRASSLPNG